MDEKAYGFLGFASLSQRRLKEGAIGVFRDMAGLVSLFLVRLKMREEMEASAKRDPTTGALRFAAFLDMLTEMAKKKNGFSLVSIKLPDFALFRRRLGMEAADAILRKMHQGIEHCMGKGAASRAGRGGGHFYVAVKGVEAPEGENMLEDPPVHDSSQHLVGSDGGEEGHRDRHRSAFRKMVKICGSFWT